MKMMLWGYFMKVAVADRLALYTDAVMSNVAHHNGTSLFVAAVFFSIQIYCDFAGYSLLAIGTAKAMGFDLIQNFRRPYLAKNVSEFWRRWHISLSTWFRDYIYFPLGGSRCSRFRTNINLMITFLVSGLWHGAAWTFVFWGGLNGALQVAERPFIKKEHNTKKRYLNNIGTCARIALTFTLMTVAWVFFKIDSIQDAFTALFKILSAPGRLYNPGLSTMVYCFLGVLIVVIEDILHERLGKHPLFESHYTVVRLLSIIAVVLYILAFGVFDGGQFIYFKF